MASAPAECIALSKSNFAANNVTQSLTTAGMIAAGYKFDDVSKAVRGLLDAGCNAQQVAMALIAATILKAGTTVPAATAAVQVGLDKAKDPNWEGWVCCRDSVTGMWFPYHSEKGWDRNIPC